MDVARALEVLGVAVLDVRTTRLEVRAVRARGDLLVAVVRRQPHLEVIRLGGGEPDVARAQADHAVRQAQQRRQWIQ